MSIIITKDALRDLGCCNCCGNVSMLASGWVFSDGCLHASHHVHWTTGQVPLHGAMVHLILGDWQNEKAERHLVEMQYHINQINAAGEVASGFMVTDAPATGTGGEMPASKALRRDEVMGTALADEVFALVDEIWLQDDRIAEIVQADQVGGVQAKQNPKPSWWRKLWGK